MTILAGFSGREVVRRFKRLGYRLVRQRGSHVRLVHPNPAHKKLTIPLHKEIRVGLLSQLIKDAGVDIDAFLS